MAMKRDPVVAADYVPGVSRLVRQTCLDVATHLGEFRDQLCVVGGLVPSLIIDQAGLPEDGETHVGTIDLDLGFSVLVLKEQVYDEIAGRLSDAGFAPDRNEYGETTAQRWRSAQGITVDFLIPPTLPGDRGGKLRNLKKNFAAFIIPGLDLAFRDFEVVTIDDRLPTGARAIREVRVCGPGAFVVLKALAFDQRGTPKDAYDLYYVLRYHRLGAAGIGTVIAGFGADANVEVALTVLRRDFSEADLVGPARVAEFLGGPDEAIEADAAGFVREVLDGAAAGPAGQSPATAE